jgi:hypothetical protein
MTAAAPIRCAWGDLAVGLMTVDYIALTVA